MLRKLTIAAVAIALSLTPAAALDRARVLSSPQLEFVDAWAAAIVAVRNCDGVAMNLDELTVAAFTVGLYGEALTSSGFKVVLDDAVGGITFKPAFCTIAWKLYGPDSAVKFLKTSPADSPAQPNARD